MKSLTGLRLVIGAEKRKENVTKRTRRNITKREEKREPKGVSYARNADIKSKTKTGKAHFHYALHPNSELNVLMKGYLKQLGDLRRQGKLNDKIQAEIKEEYEKQKKAIRKRLNEQFPNRFVDEGETPEHEVSCSIQETTPTTRET